MDNKEFGKELEKRTREFSVRIIHLSRTLPNHQIIEKPIEPEAKQISETRLRFVKVKPVKHNTGWK